MKFSELSQNWLQRKLVHKSYIYTSDLTNRVKHINRMIGTLEIAEITWIDFENGLIEFSKLNPNANKIPSQKLIKNIFQTANTIMNYAYDLRLIERNPFANRKPPNDNPTSKRKPLTSFEQELIFNTLHKLQTVALLMMLTGLRVGEVLPLKWEDINFKNKSIVVNKSTMQVKANKYIIKDGTKNTKSRVVTIPDILIEHLKKNKKADDEYITTSAGGKFHTPTTWYKMWNSYFKTLSYNAYKIKVDNTISYYDPKGVPVIIQKITPHMLRHTYASMLYDAGVDVHTARILLGHADIATTLRIYTHLSEERKVLSIDKFNNYLKNQVNVSYD